jgi:FAD/FMN-containing dehydrogenase/Fe-S oxidoreductase
MWRPLNRFMLPRLEPDLIDDPLVSRFQESLKATGYQGDISTLAHDRMALATDNSIFQMVPQMVLHPRNESDVVLVTKTLGQKAFSKLHLTARGGGTGTNGQSLNRSLVMDFSRYMTEILEINVEKGWVRVQPGVVLDQLNRALKPLGYFFSPMVSTSSRATLGGMVNNDSSGKGSLVYGKTSDHVLHLHCVLPDGTVIKTEPEVYGEELEAKLVQEDREGEIYRCLKSVVDDHADEIEKVFPKMNRFMSGYNLKHLKGEKGGLCLNYLLSGSEGTLGLMTEVKVKLTPLPAHSRMVAIQYRDFDSALRGAQALATTLPEAVECIDDKIMDMARKDAVWDKVEHLMADDGDVPVKAMNFVEYVGMEKSEVDASINQLVTRLGADEFEGVLGYVQADKPADIAALWELRKKGVGLLGAIQGARKPMAFVEDCAVPPENLADFIGEFQGLIRAHDLDFGMFGHVDAGCMHVRPCLDLTNDADVAMIKTLSDEVAKLVKGYGGVMWGEHGRGIRSEYTPDFFGPILYDELRRVKGVFDPHNQLNPGKMITPLGTEDATYKIEKMNLRGHEDRQIPVTVRESFPSAMNCNGNGACHSVDVDDVMCPSSKVTRNRIHSPKGRAGLMREWLRRLAKVGTSPEKVGQAHWWQFPVRLYTTLRYKSRREDFNHQVYQSMKACLSCKACATQCPIKVDIPSLKARFLQAYHSRYLHPMKDHLVASVERVAPIISHMGRSVNFIQSIPPIKYVVKKIGMVHAPNLSVPSLADGLASRNLEPFDVEAIRALGDEVKVRSVILVQDAFSSFYDASLVLSTVDVLTSIGVRVYVAPYRPNGKPMHIKGFIKDFEAVAQRNVEWLKILESTGLPLVGVEPSIALTYREEYVEHLGEKGKVHVQLLQEWLSGYLSSSRSGEDFSHRVMKKEMFNKIYKLFGHCTEKTSLPSSQPMWKEIFNYFGLHLELQATGCCGMAGTFGHETEHFEESKGLYKLSWKPKLAAAKKEGEIVLATGYSCRCQVKRFEGEKLQHPMELLQLALRP